MLKQLNVQTETNHYKPLFAISESLFEYVTTMVCVAIRGEPVIGVIHDPFSQKTFWAWKDVAVSENLRKIRDEPVNRMAAVKNAEVIISRSHSGEAREFVKAVFGDKTPIVEAGGAGYKVLQVVHGKATTYIHTTHIKKWDLCAGNAILDTLGGKMTTLDKESISYRSTEPVVNKNGVVATLRNPDYYAKHVYNFYQQLKFVKST